MAADSAASPFTRDATAPLAPGELIQLHCGQLSVDVAPRAGGRIAQIRFDGVEQLVGYGEPDTSAIAWGCYPMAPWAGRIRRGRFEFDGQGRQLPINLGEHAIHGVAFVLPWQVDASSPGQLDLSLALPEDERWPFGGTCRQRLQLGARELRMELSVSARDRAMPVCFGWHPWFRKPDRMEFAPQRMYPRDAEGMAVLPPSRVSPGPWDDCFINDAPVTLHRAGQSLRLTSDCTHWVVFDEPAHATCVEPQTGPPDAFNLAPRVLAPSQTASAWYRMEWL